MCSFSIFSEYLRKCRARVTGHKDFSLSSVVPVMVRECHDEGGSGVLPKQLHEHGLPGRLTRRIDQVDASQNDKDPADLLDDPGAG